MIKKLIQLFIYTLWKQKLFSHDDIRKIKYGVGVIINEFIKLIVLVVLFAALGSLKYFMFSLSLLLPVRIFSGGIHFESNQKCLLFTTLLFVLTCKAVVVLPTFNNFVYYSLAIFCIVVIALFSPCPSSNRPIKSLQKKLMCRWVAVLSTILGFAFLFTYTQVGSLLFKCGFATLFLQSIQLIMGYFYILFKTIERRIANEIIY